jgi:tetratricopeptide (TPR) repeat protein
LCWSLAELGDFQQSVTHGQKALELAEAAEHAFTILDACRELGYLHIRQGDLARAVGVLDRGLTLAQSPDLALWLPSLGSALGYAYALIGRHGEGIALLEQAVEQASRMGIVAGHALRSHGCPKLTCWSAILPRPRPWRGKPWICRFAIMKVATAPGFCTCWLKSLYGAPTPIRPPRSNSSRRRWA